MCPKFKFSILGRAPFVFLGHFGLWDVKNDETLPNFDWGYSRQEIKQFKNKEKSILRPASSLLNEPLELYYQSKESTQETEKKRNKE